MALTIQTNVDSLMALDNLRLNSNFSSRTISRLTSGYRINQSGDDAAGLAVANGFRSDISELVQGARNANDGIISAHGDGMSKLITGLYVAGAQSCFKFPRGCAALEDVHRT